MPHSPSIIRFQHSTRAIHPACKDVALDSGGYCACYGDLGSIGMPNHCHRASPNVSRCIGSLILSPTSLGQYHTQSNVEQPGELSVHE